MNNIKNINIEEIKPILSPSKLTNALPADDDVLKSVLYGREQIDNIMNGNDNRVIAIVGPCSIHDTQAALDYAMKLKNLSLKLQNKLLVVMRVYFEKPRTNVGWKGLISDPDLDNTLSIDKGLHVSRELLIKINKIGIPVATEFVDTITPQYLSDLISWVAIGARTSESQPHRMLASGLSMPVGFKNNTSGDVGAAVNAVLAAKSSHRFLSTNDEGVVSIVNTKGNNSCHVILRGGKNGTNYQKEYVSNTASLLENKNLRTKVMIDCSHDNSQKNFANQSLIIDDICKQIEEDNNHNILGFMLESNLVEGKQDLVFGRSLEYGKSITDGCVGWEDTDKLLHKIADKVLI